MGDVTQDHPEFFKPPAEQDLAPLAAEDGAPPAMVPSPRSEDVDGILGETNDVSPVVGPLERGLASNRRAGILIAVLGGVIFTILYAVVAMGLIALRQDSQFVMASTVSFLATPIFWLTAACFTGFFVLLAVIVNRGAWVYFVVGSFFLAILLYGAVLGAGLIAIHAWELTFEAAQGALWEGIAFNPIILVAPVLARETALWLGLWISRRGKRLRADAPPAEY